MRALHVLILLAACCACAARNAGESAAGAHAPVQPLLSASTRARASVLHASAELIEWLDRTIGPGSHP